MTPSKPSVPVTLAVLALTMALLACDTGPSGNPASKEVVATFDGGEILRADLIEYETPEEEAPEAANDGSETAQDWRQAAIRRLTLQKVLARRAPSDPLLEARIRAQQDIGLVEPMEHELGWDDLTVTEAEIRRQFDTHPEQYTDPEKIRVQHIYLRSEIGEDDPEARRAIRQRLESIRGQLLEGTDFTALARQHSESATAHRGGWLGLRQGERVDPTFAEAAWSLEPNEISEIIDTPNGFHVIVVREQRPGLVRQFEDVREFAKRRALSDKLAEEHRRYTAEVGTKYGLTTDFDILSDPFVPMDGVLFTIDGDPFTVQDLLDALPSQQFEHINNGYMPDVLEFLDRAVLNHLLLREAKAAGLDKDPDVARRLEAIDQDLRASDELDRRLTDRVAEVPEEEMRAYFEQNRKRYETMRRTDLSLIFLPPGDNLWSTYKLAEELTEKIRNGADFATLARKHSRHYSARDGGALKSLTDHNIARQVQAPARFRKTLANLEDGEVGDPMVAECYLPKTLQYIPTGVVIFRRDHVDLPVPSSYEEAEILVRLNYLSRNYQRLKEELERKILHEVNLRIIEDNLPAL